MDQFKTTRSTFSPSDFLQMRESQLLNITPKFQRREVWKTPARSAFIDTLLRGMPVPPIYVRNVPSAKHPLKTVREVVDGQQRINAVLDFIDGKYRLSKSLAPWSGKLFSQLNISQQQQISAFDFSIEQFKTIEDADLFEVFSRLNTYSVKLNSQELRNGQYFGFFKTSAYSLAWANLEFWRQHKIFTESSLARMLEVELTSELLIAGIAGMQDKKKSIDSFYGKFDEEFPAQSFEEDRFRKTLGTIGSAFNGHLAASEFNRVPFFYTLYCVVYHRLFGLPNAPRNPPKKPISKDSLIALRDAVIHLSEILSSARENDASVPQKYAPFVSACLRQTDNIKPRETRFKFLYDEAFGN